MHGLASSGPRHRSAKADGAHCRPIGTGKATKHSDDTVTLRTYLRILRERWRLVVTCVLVALALAVAVTLGTQKVYESTAQIFVVSNSAPGSVGDQYNQAVAAQTVAGTFASIVDAPDVISGVKSALNSPLSTSTLKSKISATAVPNKAIILLHADDPSPVLAQRIAAAASGAFITYI